ncbi:uncharacterized protein N7469_010386 [Penicillium citrinum]|uniref:Uncharacterized protein n=1 Tax=Penicillium citrinum TaxID=5077 RepID=A0A9W9NMS0_PENCI|nr:uncharacterized protein N7469_010386 [Penicillium citrinum]KAJ5221499.1 hypothetical protein N7469_010386 [Penicillium citrinum]KAK5797955.1 hypothetical protein VI817_004246 [Penicillium citrinum]
MYEGGYLNCRPQMLRDSTVDQLGENSYMIGFNSPEQPLATVGNPAVAPSGAVAEQVLESGVA